MRKIVIWFVWTIEALTAFINKFSEFFFSAYLLEKVGGVKKIGKKFGAHFVWFMESTKWNVWISCHEFILFLEITIFSKCTNLYIITLAIHYSLFMQYLIKAFTRWNWMHRSQFILFRIELIKKFRFETVHWILICITFVLRNGFTFIKCLKCE